MISFTISWSTSQSVSEVSRHCQPAGSSQRSDPMDVLAALVSFASHWFPYFAVAGVGLFCAVVILSVLYCFQKQLADGAGTEHEPIQHQLATGRETEPILPRKEVFFSYGATGEQTGSSVCCPAEDSDGDKMCRICYDAPRSCFFIPCGHCFACFACAKRIVREENKACPICRRLIHRVKGLETP